MMRRPTAHGPALAGFRALLGLLIAVVALLCVYRQAAGTEHRATPVGFSVGVEQPQPEARASHATEGDASASPCGKKAVLEQSAPRADSQPLVALSSYLSAHGPAIRPGPAFGLRASPGGPAPPRPFALISVLRI